MSFSASVIRLSRHAKAVYLYRLCNEYSRNDLRRSNPLPEYPSDLCMLLKAYVDAAWALVLSVMIGALVLLPICAIFALIYYVDTIAPSTDVSQKSAWLILAVKVGLFLLLSFCSLAVFAIIAVVLIRLYTRDSPRDAPPTTLRSRTDLRFLPDSVNDNESALFSILIRSIYGRIRGTCPKIEIIHD